MTPTLHQPADARAESETGILSSLLQPEHASLVFLRATRLAECEALIDSESTTLFGCYGRYDEKLHGWREERILAREMILGLLTDLPLSWWAEQGHRDAEALLGLERAGLRCVLGGKL